MLVKNIFYRELTLNASKILLILLIVLPITELFRLLNDSTAMNMPTITVITLVIYGTIASFPMILTIACFLTIAITLNRYCKDHEYVIWLVSGKSSFYWLWRALVFALPFAVICAICSLYITPWATLKSRTYADFLAKQAAMINLVPGVFRENPDGNQVFYIENYSLTPSRANNIFIEYDANTNHPYNITAQMGSLENNNGILSVILHNAHRYEPRNNAALNFVLDFKEFKASIKTNYQIPTHDDSSTNVQSFNRLLQQGGGHAKAELSWRISIALMLVVMSALVVPISLQTGRIKSGLVFILPPIIYAIYQNIILSLNTHLNDGTLSSVVYVMLVHVVLFMIALFLTYIKSFPRGLLWRKYFKYSLF